ncbi:Pyruvate phosphate dikinase, PEP/pyruvate binding domain protein [Verrucomicrobiia bacterium DG1235]|nr:Pyruvate phosphate dikinase, PEP/pyruvate binding domain protein [Verrucomicrobiae bacterium DG1235]
MKPQVVLLLLLVESLAVVGQNRPQVELEIGGESLQPVVKGNTEVGELSVLEKSVNLVDWGPEFVSGESEWSFEDPAAANSSEPVFYRLRKSSPPVIDADDSWRLEVDFRNEELFSIPSGSGSVQLSYVKFTIFTSDLSKVYFQDTERYPFHYEFAVEKLEPFLGISSTEFDAATLHLEDQVAILGGVIYNAETREFGVEFVGQDAYPPTLIRYLYKLVERSIFRASLRGPFGERLYQGYYMPTLSQKHAANQARDYLARHGIEIGSADMWSDGSQCYSQGWAIGRLKFVEAAKIDEAYLSGELLYSDILLTDGIPAELPFVAGIISLSAATPGSHVAILAESYGIPFVYLAGVADVEDAIDAEGKEVILDVDGKCRTHLVETEGLIDEDIRSYLFEQKETPALAIQAKQGYGKFSEDVAILDPDDIVFFGGKASNFGLLLREVPDNTRPLARAFSFDLWDDYLEQELEAELTLRERIDDTLAGYSWPVQDLGALSADLKRIRDWIEDEADFSELQRSEILETLAVFDENRKIRFRSSTNVEDSQFFSGAGLYDSKSGCLADDLDEDDVGPSACDSGEVEERGVFRAMRKVYASFYNLNAFLERLRFGVDEGEVGMAILAHYSYPDEIELANGVVRLEYDSEVKLVQVVSQPGANSVTNPDVGARPEVVEIFDYGTAFLRERAGLLPDGVEFVMTEEDYETLGSVVKTLAEAYRVFHGLAENSRFVLEFEYKKVDPGVVEVKQLRLIPRVEFGAGKKVFVGGYASFIQSPLGERSALGSTDPDFIPVVENSVFEVHYTKTKFNLRFGSRILESGKEPIQTLVEEWDWTYHDSGEAVTWSGGPSDLLGFEATEDSNRIAYRWLVEDSEFFMESELSPRWYDSDPDAFLVFADSLKLSVERIYAEDRPAGTYSFDPVNNPVEHETVDTSFEADFVTKLGEGDRFENEVRQVRSFTGVDGIEIESIFYFPKKPNWTIGYTAHLTGWDRTTILGLTNEAITLESEFAQSYAPEHHNFGEYFLFEPRLDDSVAESVLAELEALDVMQIYVTPGIIKYVGFDYAVRDEL